MLKWSAINAFDTPDVNGSKCIKAGNLPNKIVRTWDTDKYVKDNYGISKFNGRSGIE
ncbi:hypothetical protein H0I25_07430 [Cellulophaga sp. HaHa_2_95]|uniref:hypothetical protein n=1 Tax=unclassified Cellulophaga TaxID=2634405 RepID=UPI001C4F8C1D|nr:hypothetical protein [Cellulophaga sp. HaHa_2_95]QXP57603.1 hypothetical protein H0I25_07430 [Cellulophaga sp. HaHa_2_95]